MNDAAQLLGQTNTRVRQQGRSTFWLWDGVLADGAVTLLSAPEKTGKTTLLSLLLDRRRAGGELLGRPVLEGKAIVCSEESSQLWGLRQPPLDFGPDVLFRQPLGPIPTRDDWQRFVDEVITASFDEVVFDLLVIDTAVSFLPLAERNRQTLRWALSGLRELTTLPLAVLLVNQSRNVQRPLAAFADIVLEMSLPRGAKTGCRRRVFTGVGRYPGTLQRAVAELNAAGTDYTLAADSPAPPPLWSTVQTLLAESATPLTCRELLERWPAPTPRPDSLWRTLARSVERGLLATAGTGVKNDPFRYTLPPQAAASPSRENAPTAESA